jgi:lactosylceramide 4-alpha-galactosyltransferase
MNPDMDVYFMFGTKTDGVNMKYSELIEALLSYSNIHLRYFNLFEYSKGTKLENFFKSGGVDKSGYPLEHAADILRILTLNKYGGYYLDLDVFSLVPFSTINQKNFACWEISGLIANTILNFNAEVKILTDKYLE